MIDILIALALAPIAFIGAIMILIFLAQVAYWAVIFFVGVTEIIGDVFMAIGRALTREGQS